MVEYERRSFLPAGPEAVSYDIVRHKQQDIYDLEDCLEVLSMVVQELQTPDLKRSDISRVLDIQHMAKYIYMEDSIFEGLEKLGRAATMKDAQDRLLDAAGVFNKLSYDFQEEWSPEYWEIYESVRDPQKAMEEIPPASQDKISKKLLDLQEIAISLTRISRGPESKRENLDLFAKVNQEAEMYSTPSISEKQNKRDCDLCLMF
jgi:type I site-specific restriction-modification system R (restriction) subunit